MKQFYRPCLLSGAVLCALVGASPSAVAAGSLKQAYVSTTGANAAGCGASSAPCRTFQFALDNAVAVNGVIYIQRAGDYGPAQIANSVTIVNVSGGTAGVLGFAGASNGLSVATAQNGLVVLQGITIDGAQAPVTGIYVSSGSATIVDCDIRNLDKGIAAVNPPLTSANIAVYNTRVSYAASVGITVNANSYKGSAGGRAEKVTVTNSGTGASYLSVADSLFTGNRIGLAGSVQADRVTLTGNDKGFTPTAFNTSFFLTLPELSRSTIAGNRIGVELTSGPLGALRTYNNSAILGNSGGDVVGDASNLVPVQMQ